MEASYGAAGQRYVQWAASMAQSLDAGVPWIMCQQPEAPDSIVRHLTGFDPSI